MQAVIALYDLLHAQSKLVEWLDVSVCNERQSACTVQTSLHCIKCLSFGYLAGQSKFSVSSSKCLCCSMSSLICRTAFHRTMLCCVVFVSMYVIVLCLLQGWWWWWLGEWGP